MENMIHVGTDKESIIEMKIAIMEILTVLHCDELTKQAVLKALSEGVKVEGTTIGKCTFTTNEKERD